MSGGGGDSININNIYLLIQKERWSEDFSALLYLSVWLTRGPLKKTGFRWLKQQKREIFSITAKQEELLRRDRLICGCLVKTILWWWWWCRWEEEGFLTQRRQVIVKKVVVLFNFLVIEQREFSLPFEIVPDTVMVKKVNGAKRGFWTAIERDKRVKRKIKEVN